MNKQEIVYREIACAHIEGTQRFTQFELSKRLNVSISTVNAAVTKLATINAVRIKSRSFDVMDFVRLLMYWATHRSLDRDIVYSTKVDLPIGKIEGGMPNGIAFTAYTTYRLLFDEAPADYSEVYLYADNATLAEIKRRFKEKKGEPNLFVLRSDQQLQKRIKDGKTKHSSVCAAMAFIDTWNLKGWYAKEYADAFMKRLMR
jgi:hypothetical protein